MCLGRLPVALLGPNLSHEEIGLGGLRREGLVPSGGPIEAGDRKQEAALGAGAAPEEAA